MFKNTIKVLISQLFNNQQIIIENKFDLFDYKRCKRYAKFIRKEIYFESVKFVARAKRG